jgi:hypothetical protein
MSAPGRKRPGALRAIGSGVSSFAGVGGAVTIMSSHGSTSVALTIFAVMQIWGACELLFRWRIKWRYARLHEDLVRMAAARPDDQNLRTLLIDSASTYLDDVGERLPTRTGLKDVPGQGRTRKGVDTGATHPTPQGPRDSTPTNGVPGRHGSIVAGQVEPHLRKTGSARTRSRQSKQQPSE